MEDVQGPGVLVGEVVATETTLSVVLTTELFATREPEGDILAARRNERRAPLHDCSARTDADCPDPPTPR